MLQRMFEQELMTRWNIKDSMPYPAFKITEADEEAEGDVNPNDIRIAQVLTGALLCVSTRTRPDLAFGVSAMSRLHDEKTRQGHRDRVCPGEVHPWKPRWSALQNNSWWRLGSSWPIKKRGDTRRCWRYSPI